MKKLFIDNNINQQKRHRLKFPYQKRMKTCTSLKKELKFESANPTKWSNTLKHTAKADELFECV